MGCRTAQLEARWLERFPNVFVALSRADPARKVYVWHLLLERSQLVFSRFLAPDADGCVVVAGSVSSGFVRDVLSTLQTVYKLHHTGANQDQAAAWLKDFEAKGRLIQDCWG